MASFVDYRYVEQFFVLALLAGVVAGVVVFTYRRAQRRWQSVHEQRDRQIALVSKALDSGAIDQATRRRLLEAVTAPISPRARRGTLRWTAFVLGWLGLFLGIALIALGDRNTFEPGLVIGLISFGLLSLPLAMRELEGRSKAHQPSRS